MAFDLEDFLPYRLYQAAEKASQEFFKTYRERFQLRRTDWRVLFNVGQYGPISAADITRRSGLEKSKISRSLTRLEERGWVLRRVVRADRRQQEVRLSAEGRRTFETLRELAAEFNRSVARDLGGDELRQLIALLNGFEAQASSSED
ncbi:MAG: MarR family winged helix-turn-helix transcriptional regulator [Pseudomonadota bacterium]